MAVRSHLDRDKKTPRFYVYALMDGDAVAYVGKGSTTRNLVQEKRFRLRSIILERFSSETAAYQAERRYIARFSPPLNRHPGGNGSRAKRAQPYRPDKRDKIMMALDPKRYAARLLLACEKSRPGCLDPSKIDFIRETAYGTWS